MGAYVNGRSLKELGQETYAKWSRHNAPRLGASLAYYTLLSMAPLTILLVAICGIVFGRSTAQYKIVDWANQGIGGGGASAVKMLLASAHQPRTGIFASLIALVTLFFGASGVFIELRGALNTIWDAPPSKFSGWRDFVTQRLASFAMVLGLGFFLLLSLAVSAAFAVVQKFATGMIPLPAAIVLEFLNFFVSLFALTVLFALIFKFVPNVSISWRDVPVGASVTALLFMVGKSLLALYLSTAGVGSTYGAAGSIVVFVVWIYYSAQIFFFGAVFTRVYSDKFKGAWRQGRVHETESDGVTGLKSRGQTA